METEDERDRLREQLARLKTNGSAGGTGGDGYGAHDGTGAGRANGNGGHSMATSGGTSRKDMIH